MKKSFLVLIITILFSLVLIQTITKPVLASPSFWWWNVWFENRYFDSTYPPSSEQTRIIAVSLAQNLINFPDQYEVLLNWPSGDRTIKYMPPPFRGIYYEYPTLLTYANKPEIFDPDPWDGIQYRFDLRDKNTNTIVDTEFRTPPEDRFAELGYAVPNFIGNSTVTWNSVAPHEGGTIRYRLRLQNLDSDGWWPVPGLVFDSPSLTTTSFTFIDPLPGPGPYAVRLEVREYFGGNLSQYVNRSAYFTKHEVEPIPEPATILLIGSGLIGIEGLRRRFKR